ncbi:class A beta-lactamase [Streptomyces canus]|uniref:class A beta-lactamase n=1 Tax=Streptomyces canus TaxID=58343 RepID=UPI002E26CC79|nr:class A beta-lactamase [Streptomyces canus]
MTSHIRLRLVLGPAALTSALLGGLVYVAGAVTGETSASNVAARPGSSAPSGSALSKTLQELEKSYDGRIGAVGMDLGTGRTVGYRADERFPFNSMFKVFACAAVLHKARTSDPGLMDKVVRWKPAEMAELTANSPETTEYTDTGMTPAQLCRAGITKSDGFAGNTLLKQISGPRGLTEFFRAAGDGTSRLARPEPWLTEWKPGEKRDTTTPAAAARTFTELTTGKTLHPRDRARLVAWLKASLTGANRIRAGLPKDWTVGDKTGTGGARNYGTANDLAIVWTPRSNAPIVLSVFTNRNLNNTPHDDKVIASTANALAKALGRL